MKDQQWKYALKFAAAFFLVAGVVLFLARMLWVINLVIISFLIVYSISPAVEYLARFRRIPRLAAVIVVYLSFLLLLVLILNLMIPIIIAELLDLARLLPKYGPLFQPYILQVGEILDRPEVVDLMLNFLNQLPRNLQQVLNQATFLTMAVVSWLAEIAIVLFMVFFLLRDVEAIKRSVVDYLPRSWRKEAVHVLSVVDAKVGAYLRGNLVRCGLVGVLTGVGLAVMGMPFALMLGVLAGLLNIIVYIGPYLAAVPAVLIALSQSTTLAIMVIILYVIIQTSDAFILTPFLLGKAVDLHPFSVIVAILVGGRLFGLLGVILAIPVTATLKVLFNYYYRHEV